MIKKKNIGGEITNRVRLGRPRLFELVPVSVAGVVLARLVAEGLAERTACADD